MAAQAVDFVQPSPTTMGGISELCKISPIAAVRNVAVMPHSSFDGFGLLAAIHVAAALERLDGGYPEMNVYKPLMIFNIAHSITIMTDGCSNFRKFLVEGTKPNLKINEYVERSLMLVTALSPVIGHDKASKIAHYDMDNDLTLKEAALKQGFVSEAEFDRVVDPKKMVKPYVAGSAAHWAAERVAAGALDAGCNRLADPTRRLIFVSAGAGALLRRALGRLSRNHFLQPFCAATLAGAAARDDQSFKQGCSCFINSDGSGRSTSPFRAAPRARCSD